MTAAAAVTASGNATFAGKVTNFEKLTLTGAVGVQAVDLAVLGNYNYVTVAGIAETGAAAAADTLTLNKMASGGTVAINALQWLPADAADGLVVAITDAATGTADSLNVLVTAAGVLCR